MMDQDNKTQMTGEQLFEYYQQRKTDYASIVKMLPYTTGSMEQTFIILERCQNENKRLFAHYSGIDSFSADTMEPIGPIIDGYLYLVPEAIVKHFRKTT